MERSGKCASVVGRGLSLPRVGMVLALALALPAVAAAQTLPCGDCDGTQIVTILDALVAARHSAALITLTGAEYDACNVDLSAAVDILDALRIAQLAAGLPVTIMCQVAPACVVSAPAAGMSFLDTVDISADSSDPNGDALDLSWAWSTDAGLSWSPCSAAPASLLSNPALDLAPQSGVTFIWDAASDVSGAARPVAAIVRVVVDDGGRQSDCDSPSFDLAAPPSTCSPAPAWTQLTPAAGPSARNYPVGAWDSTRGRMLVHGGGGTELWAYDPAGNAWTQLTTAPGGPTTHHTMVYDPFDDCAFIWNGDAGNLWRCDFASTPAGAWVSLTPGGGWPDGHWGTMVFDTANRRLVWAGSQNVANALFELPIAAGGAPGSWATLTTTGGAYGTRWGWRGDYDPIAERMVVFSGNPNNGLDRIVTIAIPAAGPYTVTIANPPADPHSFWYTPCFVDASAGSLVIWSGTYQTSTINHASEVDLSSPTAYLPLTMGLSNPPRRYATALAHDPVTRNVYIFGGRADAGGINYDDLWRLCY